MTKLEEETREAHFLDRCLSVFNHDLAKLVQMYQGKFERSLPGYTHAPCLVFISEKNEVAFPILILPFEKQLEPLTHLALLEQWRDFHDESPSGGEERYLISMKIKDFDIYERSSIRARLIIYKNNKFGLVFDKDSFRLAQQFYGDHFDHIISKISQYGITIAASNFGFENIINFESMEREVNLEKLLAEVRDKIILAYDYRRGKVFFNLAMQYYVYRNFSVTSPLYRKLSELEDLARLYYLLPTGYPHSALID